jgi:hypothetical protein
MPRYNEHVRDAADGITALPLPVFLRQQETPWSTETKKGVSVPSSSAALFSSPLPATNCQIRASSVPTRRFAAKLALLSFRRQADFLGPGAVRVGHGENYPYLHC